jgi:hypothetical protein
MEVKAKANKSAARQVFLTKFSTIPRNTTGVKRPNFHRKLSLNFPPLIAKADPKKERRGKFRAALAHSPRWGKKKVSQTGLRSSSYLTKDDKKQQDQDGVALFVTSGNLSRSPI